MVSTLHIALQLLVKEVRFDHGPLLHYCFFFFELTD